jgi:para-nitrobenzyl esterase
VSSRSHEIWLSDVNNALIQLGSDDRQKVLEIMNDQQMQREDVDSSDP